VESIVQSTDGKKELENASPVGGNITIDTRNQDESIIITVKNSGPDISENDLERIFDPFFSRKKTMGMGVGLSICHGIIADHKGIIIADNAPEGGAVFTIRLPLE
jgi:signal transduction histidine kinase